MAVSEPQGAKPDHKGPSIPAAQQGGPDGRYAGRHWHAHAPENLRLLALQAVPGYCRAAKHLESRASTDHVALYRHHGRADREQSQNLSLVKKRKTFGKDPDGFPLFLHRLKTPSKGSLSCFKNSSSLSSSFF